MTLPYQRTNAVLEAKKFLRRLASPYNGGIKGIKGEVRNEARAILRHYPEWFDLGRADAFCTKLAAQWANAEDDEG